MGLINDAAHVSICSYSAASIVVAVEGPLSDSSFSHSALLEPSPEKKKTESRRWRGPRVPKAPPSSPFCLEHEMEEGEGAKQKQNPS